MSVGDNEVRYISKLCRLELDAEEVKDFAEQMKNILSYFKLLDEIDTDAVKAMAHVQPLQNVLRQDVVGKTLNREKLLEEAPSKEGGFIKVPSIFDE